jgi:UDPglucose 6-dehydrogenase
MKKIGIFGAGYVGLVSGTCFAELGNSVVIRDVLAEKIERLCAGEVPIFEPGLKELMRKNEDRLRFTLDIREVVDDADLLFVCVGTPPTYSGDADLSAVWTVIDELPATGASAILIMKSTVPVGTGEKVRAALHARGLDGVGYVSNPEFLAEGSAIKDFMNPDRVVIGASASSTRSRTCVSSSARTSSRSRPGSGSTTGSGRIFCGPGSASAGVAFRRMCRR